MSESKGWAGKGMLGCGALLLLACTASCLFWGFHVFLDPRGAISDDEAMPGMLGSMFCTMVSVALAVVGAFLTFRKSSAPTAGPQGSGPDSTPFRNPSAPETGAPGSGAPVKKPFPTHLVVGCGSLIVLVFSCMAFGGAGYFYDRAESAERFEQWAYDDQARYGTSYGLGPAYWQRQAEERQQFMMGSLCCGGFFLLMFFGLVGAAVMMFRRNSAKAAELAAEAADAATVPDPGPSPGGFTPPPPSG